jgi:6-phosphogluconolactonase/glucosamine-6-phosphate isomerase/deaminase
MNTVYTTTSQPTADYLLSQLVTHLEAGEMVVWLLSGGSAIEVATNVRSRLDGYDLSGLFISLVDERFGPIGHPHENWQLLLDAGFDMSGISWYRPLQGKELLETTEDYESWLQSHVIAADYSIGLFGIGSDGHTAGIKPDTVSVVAPGWAVGYTGPDFERVTMTPYAIEQLDEAVIQVFGSDKAATIHQLLYDDVQLTDQPAQVLKQVKKSTLFTDYKEIDV